MSTLTMEQKERLVHIAMDALATHSEMSEAGLGRRELHMIAVAVLRAITPEHEKQMRAHVAEEILDAERKLAATDPATEDALIVSAIHARGLIQAARIARGES